MYVQYNNNCYNLLSLSGDLQFYISLRTNFNNMRTKTLITAHCVEDCSDM